MKPNLKQLMEQGFEDTEIDIGKLSLLTKGSERILYDREKDLIMERYSYKEDKEDEE